MNKIFALLLACLALLTACKKSDPDQPVEVPEPVGKWEKIADYPGPARYACLSFVLGNKGYVGTGDPNLSDFYAYDPTSGTWTPVASLPVGRSGGVGFSLQDKGYALTGFDSTGSLKDVWAYDPAADTWTQKNDFPGVTRHDAVGFVIGNKAYMGTGWQEDVPGVQTQLKDWWEYDPVTDTWVAKANFPGGPCALAAGIGVGSKGYLGLAGTGPGPGKQWWEYDPATDKWTQKAPYPGRPRYGAGIFAIGHRIYAGSGTMGNGHIPAEFLYDWWEYDVETDQWREADTHAQTRSVGASFAIGQVGYFGLGYSAENGYVQDFWRFVVE